MIPLQRISTMAMMPTTIVTSPGFQASLCPRATIQASRNGAMQAASSSHWRVVKTSHALAPPPPLAPAMREFGFVELVVNHGRNSDRSRTSAPPMPRYSPGVRRDVSR
jgi:hypothetical protein